MNTDLSYTEIAAEYDKALEDYNDMMRKQKVLDQQIERASFILNEIREYLENPVTYKMKKPQ